MRSIFTVRYLPHLSHRRQAFTAIPPQRVFCSNYRFLSQPQQTRYRRVAPFAQQLKYPVSALNVYFRFISRHSTLAYQAIEDLYFVFSFCSIPCQIRYYGTASIVLWSDQYNFGRNIYFTVCLRKSELSSKLNVSLSRTRLDLFSQRFVRQLIAHSTGFILPALCPSAYNLHNRKRTSTLL